MSIEELIENIIKRFSEEEFIDSIFGKRCLLYTHTIQANEHCKRILKHELLSFKEDNKVKIAKLEAKCEAYEKVISNSNFKLILEDKKEETEKKNDR